MHRLNKISEMGNIKIYFLNYDKQIIHTQQISNTSQL